MKTLEDVDREIAAQIEKDIEQAILQVRSRRAVWGPAGPENHRHWRIAFARECCEELLRLRGMAR